MNPVSDKLGRPLRDLRISLTDQCNFRCAYCMPKEVFGPDFQFLRRDHLLNDDEIVLSAVAFTQLGIKKIRLTGGEPLLRPNLPKLIRNLRDRTGIEDISLTTNGMLLPRLATDLKEAGLARINVSLDSLNEERFRLMSGDKGSPDAVIKGIDAADAAGLPTKINMVAKQGVNEDDILPMLEYFRDRSMTLRFIEYMDVGESNNWKIDQVVPAKSILERIKSRWLFEPVDPDYRGEVASRYRFLDTNSEFGIITSITSPFCQNCNRVRISADGKIYTCLFASRGASLRDFLRSSGSPNLDDVIEFIAKIWLGRSDQYSENRNSGTKKTDTKKVEMSYIGG